MSRTSRAPTEYEQTLLRVTGSSGIEVLERQEQMRVTANFNRLPRKGPKAEAESLGFVFGENIEDGTDLFVAVTAPDGWDIKRTDHSMWSNFVDEQGRIRGRQFYKGAFYDLDAFYSFNSRFYVETEYEELPPPVMVDTFVEEWKDIGHQSTYHGYRTHFDDYGYDDEYMFIRAQGMMKVRAKNSKIKIVDGVIYEKVKVKTQVPKDPPKPWSERLKRHVVRDRANPEAVLFSTKWFKCGRKPPKSYDIYNKPDYFMAPAFKWLATNYPNYADVTAYWS